VATRLAPYKRPARIEFRDSLPKSPLGKVLHRSLNASL
jgi:acyl-CoA synthetase (AMP-forming)/AMP-acid ligase II